MVKKTKTTTWKWIVCFLLLSLLNEASLAQKIEGISVAFQTESIAIPLTRFAPIHPGVEVGVTLKEIPKPRSARSWNTYLGWSYHKNMDQNFYIRGEYQFAYNIKNTVDVMIPLGLGYLHSFHTKSVFEQNESGSFSEKMQIGRPHATLHTGIGIRYSKSETVEPFIKYDIMVQTPFVSTVPVGLRNFLKLGVNIKLK